MIRKIIPTFAAAALLGLFGCTTVQREIEIAEAAPVEALAEEFNNIYSSGEIFFAGIPTAAGLEAMKDRGVRTIVCTKTPEWVDEKMGLSERELAESLGMRIVYIPISPNSFDSRDVDRFADLLDHNDGPMLIHCGSSNTVGGLWAAYLHRERGVELDRAIALGEAAGLKSDSMREAAIRVANSN